MSYLYPKYIYLITNMANGKKYVGETNDYARRWKTHLSALRGRFHKNKHMQKDFNLYGESVFAFSLLEIHKNCSRISEDREFYWIKYFKTYTDACGYNDKDIKSICYINRTADCDSKIRTNLDYRKAPVYKKNVKLWER